MLLYPAILYPKDADGVAGCAVPDLMINASGPTEEAAIEDAVAVMNELLGDMDRAGEPFPMPTSAETIDLDGGKLVILQAPAPIAA